MTQSPVRGTCSGHLSEQIQISPSHSLQKGVAFSKNMDQALQTLNLKERSYFGRGNELEGSAHSLPLYPCWHSSPQLLMFFLVESSDQLFFKEKPHKLLPYYLLTIGYQISKKYSRYHWKISFTPLEMLSHFFASLTIP